MIRVDNRILFTEIDAYKAIISHNKLARKEANKYSSAVAKIEKKNWTRETKDAEIAKLATPRLEVPIECISVLWDMPSRGFSDTGSSLRMIMLENKELKASYNADVWAEEIAQSLSLKYYEKVDNQQ